MASDRLIHWICTSRAHRHSSELGLTRHEDQWALCPDLLGADHEWLDTGGIEVSEAAARWELGAGIDRRRPAAA